MEVCDGNFVLTPEFEGARRISKRCAKLGYHDNILGSTLVSHSYINLPLVIFSHESSAPLDEVVMGQSKEVH